MLNEIWFKRQWIVAWIKWILNLKVSNWDRFIIEIGP